MTRRPKETLTYNPFIPAQPGYYLIQFSPDERFGRVYRDPIIAWEMESGVLVPHGLCGGNDHGTVLCPDGQVIEPGGGVWEDLDTWRAQQIEEGKKPT